MTKRADKPWTTPATSLELYRTHDRWRWASVDELGGILDGFLQDVDVSAPVGVAKAVLVRITEERTQLEYEVAWDQDKEDWWSAQLTKVTTAVDELTAEDER